MKSLALILLSILLSGCLTTRTQMREQIARKGSPQRASEVEPAQDVDVPDQVRPVASQNVSESINSQFRELRGRIELLETKRAQEEVAESNSAMNKQNEKILLEERLKLYKDAILKLETEVAQLRQELSSMKSAKANSSATKEDKELGNYGQAEQDFANKAWKKAIVGYQKYRDLNPTGNRYADATYKIGVSFTELGMKKEAKPFFEEVLQKYPKSRTAKKAEYRLKNLK